MFDFLKSKNKRIYFDNASAVPVLYLAKKSFLQTLEKSFANSSSIHSEGEVAKEVLFEARKKVAKFIHAKPNNLHFTSSTTEANNIFIKGVVLNAKTHPDCVSTTSDKEVTSTPHIIYSKSDHSAIVDVVENCKIFGASFTSITPNKIGLLPIEEILKEINPNTRLICFSHVSSELGTIQPVRKIVQAVHQYWDENFSMQGNLKVERPKIFVDSTQAVKYEQIDVHNLNVDGLSFGASKLGGVSGTAVLYVKNGTNLVSIISGGGQEEGVRSGTENLPAIVVMGELLEALKSPLSPLYKGKDSAKEKVFALRNYTIEKLNEVFITNLNTNKKETELKHKKIELEIFGDTKFKYNKYFEHAAPHILLLSLVDMLGEETLLRLDAKGISVSTASACSLLENSGSSFLKSIGEPVKAKETIRLSFSENNTKQEIDYFVKTLREIKDRFLD